MRDQQDRISRRDEMILEFFGCCDRCLDFYPVTGEEWLNQLGEAAQQIMDESSDKSAKPHLQLCPICKYLQEDQ
jgi:hypothetical protein